MSDVGVIDLPIDDVLCCGEKNRFDLPLVTRKDWQLLRTMHSCIWTPSPDGGDFALPDKAEALLADTGRCLRQVKELSFYDFLVKKMFDEARRHAADGIRCLMLSNKGCFNFGARHPEPTVYWMFRSLMGELSGDMDDFEIGIEICEGLNGWAVDLACRCKGVSFAVLDCMDKQAMAALMLKANRACGGAKRPDMIVRAGRERMGECIGFDGILLESSNAGAISADIPIWQCIDQFGKRMMHRP